MSKLRSLGVAAVFLAGCAVGGASSRFVVPPASAQQAAALHQWEYSCSIVDTALAPSKRVELRTARANALGAQAWEFVEIDGDYWCFKRPKM